MLPFILVALSGIHVHLLHVEGSSAFTGLRAERLRITLIPYFMVKDLVGLLAWLVVYGLFVGFWSDVLGHSDNYIAADGLVTPVHIVPEWYFLPYYAVLRSIPHKLGGVVAMLLAILVVGFMPWVHLRRIRLIGLLPITRVGL